MKESLQKALDALGPTPPDCCGCQTEWQIAIDAIKAALEAKDEPVAWISPTELLVMRGNALGGAKDWRVNLGLTPEEGDVGLYTTPPQRTWVGLTEAQCGVLWKVDMTPFNYYQVIEAKLKERNS